MSVDSRHPAILTDRADLLTWRASMRAGGRRVVQCHGCFDIVHPGHVRHLRWARAQGEALLVTITSDHGIDKGPGRPLIPHDLRAENLASLDMVDAVHIVHEPTAEGILRIVEPDIYVKGREYETNNDPRFAAERKAVQDAGGRVVFSSGDIVFSSSALIAALEGGRDTGVDQPTGTLSQLMQSPGMAAADLGAVIDRAEGRRVLVIGEAVQEIYRVCQAPQLAAREPIMTLRPAGERRFDAGATAVAMNLAAMGLQPTLLTCPPPSRAGQAFLKRMRTAGIHVEPLGTTTEPLLVEHYLAGAQKLMTIDHAKPFASDAALGEAVIDRVRSLFGRTDAICIADQGLGMLGGATTRALSDTLDDRSCVLTASAQARNASPLAVRGADLLYVGEAELRRAVANPSGSLTSAAWSAMDATRANAAIIGLGPEGLLAFSRLPEAIDTGDGWPSRVSAQPVPSLSPIPLDTTGADAAVLAASTLAMLGARSPDSAPAIAAVIGVLADAEAVARPGFATVGAGELRSGLARLDSAHLVYRDPDPADARVAS